MRSHSANRIGTVVTLAAALALPAGAIAQLDQDRRSTRPGPPDSVEELQARFVPDYVPLTSAGTVELEQGANHTFSLAVEAGACYAAIALGLGPTDVDVRVRRDGATVAMDGALDPYPVATWCPVTDGVDRISIRAFQGSGLVEYLVLIDPDTREAGFGELDELSNRLVVHVARAAPRWEPRGSQWRSGFELAGEQTMALQLPAGRCTAVAVVGQSSVEDIDLLLTDAVGTELARDFALDATPLVAYCADRDIDAVLRIAVRVGRGVVAAQVLDAAHDPTAAVAGTEADAGDRAAAHTEIPTQVP